MGNFIDESQEPPPHLTPELVREMQNHRQSNQIAADEFNRRLNESILKRSITHEESKLMTAVYVCLYNVDGTHLDLKYDGGVWVQQTRVETTKSIDEVAKFLLE